MHFRIAKFFAIIIGIESFLVITGWALGFERLTRILPSGINMKFSTAIVFFLCAWCLYYMSKSIEEGDKLARRISLVLGSLILLEMFLLFISVSFGLLTSIEELFIKQGNFWFGAGSPSLPTTINFMLFGLVSIFSFFHNKWLYFRLKFFGYIILVIGIIPVVGYIFDVPVLYYQFSSATTPMALNTALTFILLSCGLIVIGNSKNKIIPTYLQTEN